MQTQPLLYKHHHRCTLGTLVLPLAVGVRQSALYSYEHNANGYFAVSNDKVEVSLSHSISAGIRLWVWE